MPFGMSEQLATETAEKIKKQQEVFKPSDVKFPESQVITEAEITTRNQEKNAPDSDTGVANAPEVLSQDAAEGVPNNKEKGTLETAGKINDLTTDTEKKLLGIDKLTQIVVNYHQGDKTVFKSDEALSSPLATWESFLTKAQSDLSSALERSNDKSLNPETQALNQDLIKKLQILEAKITNLLEITGKKTTTVEQKANPTEQPEKTGVPNAPEAVNTIAPVVEAPPAVEKPPTPAVEPIATIAASEIKEGEEQLNKVTDAFNQLDFMIAEQLMNNNNSKQPDADKIISSIGYYINEIPDQDNNKISMEARAQLNARYEKIKDDLGELIFTQAGNFVRLSQGQKDLLDEMRKRLIDKKF